jgi:glycerol-3-phosphate acyltransferase PlsY
MGAQSFISILQLILPAYFLGSIPFGLLIGKIGGLDIRLHGSRNIGATNVWRTLGPKFGLSTFLLDAAKGFFAVALAQQIAWRQVPQPAPEDYLAYAGVFAALACIIGHSFPIWLRFKGGKGVATSLGVLIGLLPGFATGVVLAVWAFIFATSRYVSLASVVAALALPITVGSLLYLHRLEGNVYFAFSCAAALLVIRRHRENIRRLLAGTENRFGKKSEA